MKKIMKKWTSILTAVVLVLAMLTAAMADTLYTTDGFTIPSERIGGVRVPIEEPIIEDEPVETTPTEPENAEPAEPQEIESEEALDEQNVEGLIVVDGEEKTEDEIITEQTEVRTNEAEESPEELIEQITPVEQDNSGTATIETQEIENVDVDNVHNDETEVTETEKTDALTSDDTIDESDDQVSDDENSEESDTATQDNHELSSEADEIEIRITYEKDEAGYLVLDIKGNPIPLVPEGMDIPVKYQRDENGELVLDENGDPIPTETIAAGSEAMMSLEDQLNPNRTMDVYLNYDKSQGLGLGTKINMTVVMNGYDNLVYTLQWKYSKDGTTWYDCPGETQKTMTIQLSMDNYRNWWTVEAEITGIIDE